MTGCCTLRTRRATSWGEAEECKTREPSRVGEIGCVSRVYTILGRAEPATWHGPRLPRAVSRRTGSATGTSPTRTKRSPERHALAGDGEAAQWKSKAREAGDAIADAEDREHFDEDYATL